MHQWFSILKGTVLFCSEWALASRCALWYCYFWFEKKLLIILFPLFVTMHCFFQSHQSKDSVWEPGPGSQETPGAAAADAEPGTVCTATAHYIQRYTWSTTVCAGLQNMLTDSLSCTNMKMPGLQNGQHRALVFITLENSCVDWLGFFFMFLCWTLCIFHCFPNPSHRMGSFISIWWGRCTVSQRTGSNGDRWQCGGQRTYSPWGSQWANPGARTRTY